MLLVDGVSTDHSNECMLCCRFHTNTCKCQLCDTPTSGATSTLSMRLQSAESDQIEVFLYCTLLIGVVCGAVVATAQDRDTGLAGRGQPLQAGSWHSSACWRGQERSHSCRVFSPRLHHAPTHSTLHRTAALAAQMIAGELKAGLFFPSGLTDAATVQGNPRHACAWRERWQAWKVTLPHLLSRIRTFILPSIFQLACSRLLRCA